jgi:NADPH2:quinone reductase
VRASVMHRAGDPSVLTYQEVPNPIPGSRDVLIQVRAIGVQGGDTLRRYGGTNIAAYPHIVGYQAAGEVLDVGAEVSRVSVGDRVAAMMTSGSHAELACVPEDSVFVLPDELDFRRAAAVPIEFGTAAEALFEKGHLKLGESVVVTAAAGGVGLAALQLAKRGGAYPVIGTASSDERAKRLRDFGADQVINYATEDLAARIREITNRRGVDLVVESVGGSSLEACVTALVRYGRVVWVGAAGREATTPDIRPIIQNNATIHGVHFGTEQALHPARVRRTMAGILHQVAVGDLVAHVDKVFSLEEAAEAHRFIESRQAFGRVVIEP